MSVIKGIVAAEDGAIGEYRQLIKLCGGDDHVTRDLCIQALASEETHRREFIGFLKEYDFKR